MAKKLTTTVFDGAQPSIMQTKNTFLHSLLFIPLVTSMMSTPGLGAVTVTEIHTKLVKGMTAEAVIEAPKEIDTRPAKIDAYFSSKGLPFVGYGKKLVEEADKRGLDWRLVAAIAMRESTGGKFKCQKVENNLWGWHSCKAGFESMDIAIEKITEHLAGDNPKTSKYYEGKDVKGILQTYNPPSIVAKYADQVMDIMDDIGNTEITETSTTNNTNS